HAGGCGGGWRRCDATGSGLRTTGGGGCCAREWDYGGGARSTIHSEATTPAPTSTVLGVDEAAGRLRAAARRRGAAAIADREAVDAKDRALQACHDAVRKAQEAEEALRRAVPQGPQTD